MTPEQFEILLAHLHAAEVASRARHEELLKRIAEVADLAACADQNASEVSSRLQRILDGE